MLMVRLVCVFFILFLEQVVSTADTAESEECYCPEGFTLVCQDTVTVSRYEQCFINCVDFVPSQTHANDQVCRKKQNFEQNNLGVIDTDEIECICVRQNDYNPLCTTSLTDYINECSMKCFRPGSDILHYGRCDVTVSRTKHCFVKCGRNLERICGTDGRSYPNDCILNCFIEEYGAKELGIKHKGRCVLKDMPWKREKMTSLRMLMMKHGGRKVSRAVLAPRSNSEEDVEVASKTKWKTELMKRKLLKKNEILKSRIRSRRFFS